MKINALLLIVSLILALPTVVHADQRPNIIMVLVDDMGYSDLGAYGGEVRTPNIDKLAAGGLRFTQTYNSARCCPSRASLLTGLYSHQAGIANFTGSDRTKQKGPAYLGRLNKQCVTLAEVLKGAGYNTYCVGKWHVGHQESPVARGFDEFYGYTRGYSANQWNVKAYQRLPAGRKPEITHKPDEFYATDAFTDYAVEFIKQAQKKDQPYFLYLAHSSPHFPLQAPAKTRDAYLEIYRRGWDVLRKERYQRQETSGLAKENWRFTERSVVPLDREDIANGFPGKQNPAWKTISADRREDLAYRMATFAAMVEHVDQGIGRIVSQLNDGGDLDNTLIMLTSDNGACYEWGPFGFDGPSRRGRTTLHKGEALKKVGGPGTHHSVGSAWSCLSNTPFRLYKHFNHEGGQCSPTIAHWPAGIKKPNRWVRSPTHLIDIMPTLCAVGGASYPQEHQGHKITPVEGVSLKPLFDGADTLPARTLYFDHFGSSAIRQGDWKLVRANSRVHQAAWELYNIAEDRCETRDLIKSNPEKAKSLESQWKAWAARVKLESYFKTKPVKADNGATDETDVKFSFGDTSDWGSKVAAWKVAEDVKLDEKNQKRFAISTGTGVLVNGDTGHTRNLLSTHQHGDVEAHIEFMVPKGSNSGVYFQGRYEVQILDSWGKEKVGFGDCGGIYERWGNNGGFEGTAPATNASLPPGKWQTFDVTFRAPKFDATGKKTANAVFVKVVHNGKVIHENVEVSGPTRASGFRDEKPTGPLMLQGDHGPVAYRNIRLSGNVARPQGVN